MRNIENIFWGSVAVREFMYRDSVDFFDTKTDFILGMLGFKDWFDTKTDFVYLDREPDFILGILGFKGLVLTYRQVLFIWTESQILF